MIKSSVLVCASFIVALVPLGSMARADAPLQTMRPQARVETAVQLGSLRFTVPPDAPPLRKSVAQMIRSAGLDDKVSVHLRDLQSGRDLIDIRANVSLPPASVTKAVTSLYALEFLTPDTVFSTRIYATGPIEGGIIEGDLILAGGGDPSLDSQDLAQMAHDLADPGIGGITMLKGRFLVWGGALPYVEELEPGQFDHFAYNPALSGLNLNQNQVFFQWLRRGAGYDLWFEARADQLRTKLDFIHIGLRDDKAPVFRSEGPDRWSVARGALGERGGRWLPVRQPARLAGEVFREMAKGEGLILPAPILVSELPQGELLVEHQSRPLRDILRNMLYYSTNVTAEAVGLAASKAQGIPASSLSASANAMSLWLNARYGTTAHFADHSGLSDANAITAAELTQILSHTTAQTALLPLLKQAGPGAATGYPGSSVAKTGTLDFVSALAGYVTGPRGDQFAFAILGADLRARAVGQASGAENPAGSSAWIAKARRLQRGLLNRWRLLSGPLDGEVARP